MNIEVGQIWHPKHSKHHEDLQEFCIVEDVDSKVVKYFGSEGNRIVRSKRSFLSLYEIPDSESKPYTIENVGVGTELGKRVYLENTIIHDRCKCGYESMLNLGRLHYLDYPKVGKRNIFYYCCEECEEDCQIQYKLEMNLTIY